MKKMAGFFALLLLLLAPVSAADGAVLGSSAVSASCGEVVTIQFDIQDNPGLAAWMIELRWDSSGLSVVEDSVRAASAFSNGTLLSSSKGDGVLYVSWFHARNNVANGSVFSVDFRISEQANADSYEISVIPSAPNTIDEKECMVKISAENARITVLDPKKSAMPGDKPDANSEQSGTSGNTENSGEAWLPQDFIDVPKTHWGYAPIMQLAHAGIVNGTGANRFAPDAPVTRAAFVKMLAGIAKADVSGYSGSRFSDVAVTAWYAPYVEWAAENAVTTGTTAETFSPQKYVTRQQAATLIWRLADRLGVQLRKDTNPTAFTDEKEIAPYATEAVLALQRAGILTGSAGRFLPNNHTSRAAVAKMLAAVMTQAQGASSGQEAGS